VPPSRTARRRFGNHRASHSREVHREPGDADDMDPGSGARLWREFPRDGYTVARREKTGDLGDRMRPTPESSTQEVLAGLVERVTFHNAENGFCVLRAKARGHRDLVTVVGHAVIISAGEWITASGEWTNDRTHGQQFKARFLKTSAPSSIDDTLVPIDVPPLGLVLCVAGFAYWS
jgi:hypothetical protein